MANHRIILVATPEPLARQELLARFSGQGHQVIAVERGSDALLVVAEESVGLVFWTSQSKTPQGQKRLRFFERCGLACR